MKENRKSKFVILLVQKPERAGSTREGPGQNMDIGRVLVSFVDNIPRSRALE
jgi:hypothetical protein